MLHSERGSAIQYDRSGCDTAWADTRGGIASLLLVRRKAEFLVVELAELREMLVCMKRTVTGQGLE